VNGSLTISLTDVAAGYLIQSDPGDPSSWKQYDIGLFCNEADTKVLGWYHHSGGAVNISGGETVVLQYADKDATYSSTDTGSVTMQGIDYTVTTTADWILKRGWNTVLGETTTVGTKHHQHQHNQRT